MSEQLLFHAKPPVDGAMQALARETCDLCGLPMGPAASTQVVGEALHRFCCPGCRQVFQILSGSSGELPPDFRTNDLYRACVEAGVIPGNGGRPGTKEIDGPEAVAPSIELAFGVEGMWCPACGWLIEEVLKRTTGVTQPRVSFFTDAVRLRYLPHLTAPAEIMSRIRRLGYGISPLEGQAHRVDGKPDLLKRLGISAILTMNAMMLSCALYFGFVRQLTPMVVAYFSYPLLFMTTPVVFYGGLPILRKAWAGIRFGTASMDTLIAVGALAAFCYSVIQLGRGSIHLYFDTSAMLITIVLLGRYIEMNARERVLASVRPGLDEIGSKKVRLAGGKLERWVGADAVRPGDHFLVRSGERVPLDGRIHEGEGALDQSVLTGESIPTVKRKEEQVMAGSLLVDGELEVVASRPARESSLRQMAELTLQALDRKNSGEQMADSVSRLFVPATMAVATFTGLVAWFFNFPAEEILLRCLTVLVISCPCALGIAAPLIKVAIIGLGREKGVLVKNPEALERVPTLDTLILDKTGTVTEGSYILRDVICPETDEAGVLSRIAAIEAGSSHFLAREIVRRANDLGVRVQKCSEVEEFTGMGVTGVESGAKVFAGNRHLLSMQGAEIPAFLETRAAEQEKAGMTVVFFGWDGRVMGLLVFGDRIRQGARELVGWLQSRGMRVILLSGDGNRTTESVAGLLGIADFLGQTLPAEKAGTVRQLKAQGRKVGMVGDGVNDEGALAEADVAFAMGSGHDVMKFSSDLIIPGGGPAVIIDAFRLSALSVSATRQNLCFAFLYNAVAIPVAAAGLLNPLIAVFVMFASSLSVIGNAIRVSKGRKKIVDQI